MKHMAYVSSVAMLGAIMSGCVMAAPGADQVKITRSASDVAACKAVGLGANVVLNTGGGGVAYKCN